MVPDGVGVRILRSTSLRRNTLLHHYGEGCGANTVCRISEKACRRRRDCRRLSGSPNLLGFGERDGGCVRSHVITYLRCRNITQSQLTFQSGGKAIRLDAFLPANHGNLMPAVVALHGAGGDVNGMDKSAALLAEQGFAVYVLHYFDRTDTESADKATILRNFPIWMKTLWMRSASSRASRPWIASASRCSAFRWALSLAGGCVDRSACAGGRGIFRRLPARDEAVHERFCPVLILHGDADPTVPVQRPTSCATCSRKRIFLTKSRSIRSWARLRRRNLARYGPARVEVSTRAFGRETIKAIWLF